MKLLIGFKPSEYPGVEAFERLGECTFLRYDKEYLKNNLNNYNILVPHLFEKINYKLLSEVSELKVIATPSTGTDHIDLKSFNKLGIKLISLNDVPEFINEISSTAEMSWLLTMACARKLPSLMRRVQGEKSWVNTDIRGLELSGKTIGIIGFGRLGKIVARYAKAFQMNVLVNDNKPSKEISEDIEMVSFAELLKRSDIISIHVKLNDTSKALINFESIKLMKKGVIIVNTARGEVLDSDAVISGLNSEKISALGIDVCNNEYQSAKLPNDPLIERAFIDDRIIVTPHAGGSTYDAHAKVFNKISELIENYLKVNNGLYK